MKIPAGGIEGDFARLDEIGCADVLNYITYPLITINGTRNKVLIAP